MSAAASACLESSGMAHPAHLALRYEALFQVSDSLRVHRDLRALFRVLPLQLRPVLDFDYMSVFLSAESSNQAYWYVLDDEDQPVLTLAQDVPIEQAQVSWAFEHQQPTVVCKMAGAVRFHASNACVSE